MTYEGGRQGWHTCLGCKCKATHGFAARQVAAGEQWGLGVHHAWWGMQILACCITAVMGVAKGVHGACCRARYFFKCVGICLVVGLHV